jgi:rhomboid protease GluP
MFGKGNAGETPAVPGSATIAVRNQRQAMDWSLVLVSQGIEAVIRRPTEMSGWELTIPSLEHARALEALRLYRKENRHLPWQQRVSDSGLVFDWTAIAWVGLVIFFYWLDARTNLRAAGLMNPNLVRHGEWFRLFTAVWLHADQAHLGSNAAIGLVLLGLAMGRFGTGVGLVAAYLAGAGGNVLRCLLPTGPTPSLGASGMVMGALGLVAIQSVFLWSRAPVARKFLVTAMGAGLFLFMFMGLSPGTDVLAHLGGFVVGLALGQVLIFFAPSPKSIAINFIGMLIFILLTIIPWWLAIAGH